MNKLIRFIAFSLCINSLILPAVSQANSNSKNPGVEKAKEMKQACTVDLPINMQSLISGAKSLIALLQREKSELKELKNTFQLSKNSKTPPFVPTEDLKKVNKKLDLGAQAFNSQFKKFLKNQKTCSLTLKEFDEIMEKLRNKK